VAVVGYKSGTLEFKLVYLLMLSSSFLQRIFVPAMQERFSVLNLTGDGE
jgi:hypothetical protein